MIDWCVGQTLFLTVYDDTGGFYDHVIPPHVGVPADEANCGASNNGCPTKYCRNLTYITYVYMHMHPSAPSQLRA